MSAQKRLLPEINPPYDSLMEGYGLVPPGRFKEAATAVFGYYDGRLADEYLIFERHSGAQNEPMGYSDFVRLYKQAEKTLLREDDLATAQSASLDSPKLRKHFGPAIEHQLVEYAKSHGPLFGAAGACQTDQGPYIVESKDDWWLAYTHITTAVMLHQLASSKAPSIGDGGLPLVVLPYRLRRYHDQERERYALTFKAQQSKSLAMKRIGGVHNALHEESDGCSFIASWEKEPSNDDPASMTVTLSVCKSAENGQLSRSASIENRGPDDVRRDLMRMFRAVVMMNLPDVRVGFPCVADLATTLGTQFGSALTQMWYDLAVDSQIGAFRECQNCGTFFVRESDHAKRFCSDSCRALYAKKQEKPLLNRARQAFTDGIASYEEVYERVFGLKLECYDKDSRAKMDKLDTMIGGMLDNAKYRIAVSKGACTVDSPIHEQRQRDRAKNFLFCNSSVTHRKLFKAAYRREPSYNKPPSIDNNGLNNNLVTWIDEYLTSEGPSNQDALKKLRSEIVRMHLEK